MSSRDFFPGISGKRVRNCNRFPEYVLLRGLVGKPLAEDSKMAGPRHYPLEFSFRDENSVLPHVEVRRGRRPYFISRFGCARPISLEPGVAFVGHGRRKPASIPSGLFSSRAVFHRNRPRSDPTTSSFQGIFVATRFPGHSAGYRTFPRAGAETNRGRPRIAKGGGIRKSP